MSEREQIRVGKRTISISNRAKILFPSDGITKGELIDYYIGVAPRMVPLVRDRPLTMERFPDGTEGERIMQKNAGKYFPEWIPRYEARKRDGSVTHVLAIDACWAR